MRMYAPDAFSQACGGGVGAADAMVQKEGEAVNDGAWMRTETEP